MTDNIFAGIDLDSLIRGKLNLCGFEEHETYTAEELKWINAVISSYTFLNRVKENFEEIGKEWFVAEQFSFAAELYKDFALGNPKSLRNVVEKVRRYPMHGVDLHSNNLSVEQGIVELRKMIPRQTKGMIFTLGNLFVGYKEVKSMKKIDVIKLPEDALTVSSWIGVVKDRFGLFGFRYKTLETDPRTQAIKDYYLQK